MSAAYLFEVIYHDGRPSEYRTAETLPEAHAVMDELRVPGSAVAEYIVYEKFQHTVRTETWVDR